MKKIVRFFGNFLVYIAIVVVTIFGMPRFLSWFLETPYPMAAITSGSMWPALKEGDLVFIEGVKKDELAKGDVVVYRNRDADTFTIHRVVSLDAEQLVTKGDANFTQDEPIGYDAVVGRAWRINNSFMRIPRLGALTVFASKVNYSR
ncbi:MAG: signal peptidase, endoplasmic reticulum-type [Parcubacteria group bacterium Gr01-1014_66]|nr:MAG: signal peptidase, endoplasmic reticulum-type [Parcubacteria group bacterium Gr01-1014_66]